MEVIFAHDGNKEYEVGEVVTIIRQNKELKIDGTCRGKVLRKSTFEEYLEFIKSEGLYGGPSHLSMMLDWQKNHGSTYWAALVD